jgi:predicted ATPase
VSADSLRSGIKHLQSMKRLNTFGVGNFRVFNGIYNFDFSPITVLTGKNSSGKSSLIKALMLIQSAIKNNPHLDFPFVRIDIPRELNIGNYKTIKNKSSKNNQIVFELPARFTHIKDELVANFSYTRGGASIDNLTLCDFKIIHIKSQQSLIEFRHDDEQSYVSRINYSLFHKLFLDYFNSAEQVLIRTQFAEASWFQENIGLHITDKKALLHYIIFEEKEWLHTNIDKIIIEGSVDEKIDYIENLTKARNKIEEMSMQYGFSPEELLLRWELSKLDSYSSKIKEEKYMVYDPLFSMETLVFASFETIPFVLKDTSRLAEVVFTSDTINDKNNDRNDLSDAFSYLDSLLSINYTIAVNARVGSAKLRQFDHLKELIENDFKQWSKNLRHTFSSVEFISSVRSKVDRIYRIGSNDSLLHEIVSEYLNTKFEKRALDWLSIACSEVLEISKVVTIKPNKEDESFADIYLENNGSVKKIADYGYGISQLIPILLKIHITVNTIMEERSAFPEDIYSQFSHVIIIEEPETNLHPSLQSKLADLFVFAAKSLNIQFIIETHSEYLIRKLQYLTAKKEINSDFTQIYYFHHPDDVSLGKKQISKINILEDGRLSDDFGTGFFDETTKLIESIWEARNLN